MPSYAWIIKKKHLTKAANWVLEFLENETKTFLVFIDSIFFAPDEGFCWIACGRVQNLWTNILMFKFIVLSLVTQCYKSMGWDETFTKWMIKHGVTNPVND